MAILSAIFVDGSTKLASCFVSVALNCRHRRPFTPYRLTYYVSTSGLSAAGEGPVFSRVQFFNSLSGAATIPPLFWAIWSVDALQRVGTWKNQFGRHEI